MKHLARRFLFLSAILWTVALLSAIAQPAWAEISGNCEAIIADENVRGRSSSSAGDAIDVEKNEVVSVNFTSPAGFESHKIDLEIAGVSRTVSSQTDDGDPQWSGSVNVNDYAWAGVGLYKVSGSSILSDGSTCSGAALVNVKGDPLATAAGIAAAATTAVGAGGLVASAGASGLEGARAGRRVERWISSEVDKITKAEARRESERSMARLDAELRSLIWPFCPPFVLPALLLTGAAMVGGGAPPPAQWAGLRLRRATWRPRISGAGLLGGLLAGAGIVVLLQQYAVAPLTRTLAIEGLVIGLAVGLVLPSLVRVWSVTRVNGVVARGERRLNEAIAQAGPPPEGGPHQPPEGGPQTPPEGGPQTPPEGGQTPPEGGQTPPEEPQG